MSSGLALKARLAQGPDRTSLSSSRSSPELLLNNCWVAYPQKGGSGHLPSGISMLHLIGWHGYQGRMREVPPSPLSFGACETHQLSPNYIMIKASHMTFI